MEFPYPKLKETFLVESCRLYLDVKLNVAGYKKNTNDLIQNYYVNLEDDLNSNTIQIGNIKHLTENSLKIWWRQDCPNTSAHSGLKNRKIVQLVNFGSIVESFLIQFSSTSIGFMANSENYLKYNCFLF